MIVPRNALARATRSPWGAAAVPVPSDWRISLAAATGWPCVPLRRGLTVLGTDWAWGRFAATALPVHRADARHYLEQLRGFREAPERRHAARHEDY